MHSDPELLALMALGEDVGAVDRSHVAGCPDCTREVSELSQLVGLGRTAESAPELLTPPQRVWDRMVLELGLGGASSESSAKATAAIDLAERDDVDHRDVQVTNGALAHVTVPAHGPRHAADEADAQPSSPRRGRRWAALVLAAAVMLIVGFVLGNVISLPGRSETIARTELVALPQWPESVGTAHVEQQPDGQRFLVVTMSTPQPVDGSREVWLINTSVTSMRAVGYLNGSSGRWVIPAELDLSQFAIVDVSREPVDDPSPAHSKNSIVRGTLSR